MATALTRIADGLRSLMSPPSAVMSQLDLTPVTRGQSLPTMGYGTKDAVSAPVGVQTPASWTQYGAFLHQTDISPRMAWMLYESVGTLAKVVDLIADNVAMLDPMVMIDGKPAPNQQPILEFLNAPGFNRDRSHLIRELTVQHLLSGTAYLSSLGNISYEPNVFDVLKSMFVTNVSMNGHYPSEYIYAEGAMHKRYLRQGGMDYRWIDETGMAEVTPILAMDGYRRGVGRSRLSAIREDVELRLKGTKHNSSVMDKGATPSSHVNFKQGLTVEQAQDLQRQIREQIGGYSRAGSVIVTGGGEMQYQQLSMSPKDMDWSNLVKVVDDVIVARYNVPPTLFNSDAQTDNNYETSWNMFYDNAVLPEFQTIWGGIGRCLSYRLGMKVSFKHNASTNNILFRQAAARATELKAAGIYTTNEARDEIGKEPLIGGDYIYGTGMEQPLEEDVWTETSKYPAVAPPMRQLPDEQQGKNPEGPRGEKPPKREGRDQKHVMLT